MPHIIKLSLVTLWALFVFSVFSNTPVVAYSMGPEPGNTGAPGESTCSTCHSGAQPTGQLKIEGLPATYAPSQEFTITVTLTQPGRVSFGFQATILNDMGSEVGTLSLTDATRTGLSTLSVGGNQRQYVQQTLAGTSPVSSGTGSWTFKWQAPPTAMGHVTLYVSGLAANGDFGTFGDAVYAAIASSKPG